MNGSGGNDDGRYRRQGDSKVKKGGRKGEQDEGDVVDVKTRDEACERAETNTEEQCSKKPGQVKEIAFEHTITSCLRRFVIVTVTDAIVVAVFRSRRVAQRLLKCISQPIAIAVESIGLVERVHDAHPVRTFHLPESP